MLRLLLARRATSPAVPHPTRTGVANNWLCNPAVGQVQEALSTVGAGQCVVVFSGTAKPVAVPLIGPPRAAVE